MERHEVTVQYLHQTAPLVRPPVPVPARKIAMMRAEKAPASFYRFLFNGVGEPHRWVSRRYMPDGELLVHIHHPDVHIHVLYVEGVPAGYTEIDARSKEFASIKFFGLLPEFKGQGLGRWFFREATELAWQMNRPSVIIETCTLDDPRALRLYQREGFTIYDTGKGVIEWRG